jgi:hypothetical protein
MAQFVWFTSAGTTSRELADTVRRDRRKRVQAWKGAYTSANQRLPSSTPRGQAFDLQSLRTTLRA